MTMKSLSDMSSGYYSRLLYFLNKLQFVRFETLKINEFDVQKYDSEIWNFDQLKPRSEEIKNDLINNVTESCIDDLLESSFQ